MAQCKASLALSLLLLVKEYLKAAYSVNGERIVAFAAGEGRVREGRRGRARAAAGWGHRLHVEASTAPSAGCAKADPAKAPQHSTALRTHAPHAPPPPPPLRTAGERRRAEEKVVVSALPAVPTHLDKLDLGAHRDPQRLRAQYKVRYRGGAAPLPLAVLLLLGAVRRPAGCGLAALPKAPPSPLPLPCSCSSS